MSNAADTLDEQRVKDNEEFRTYHLLNPQYTQYPYPQYSYPQYPYPQYPYPYPQPIQYPQPIMLPPQYITQHQPQESQAPQAFQEEPISFPWTQPPLPEFLDPRKSIDLKLVRKTKKKDTRCYTCKPRGKVKKHMINTSSSGNFVFHHDMHKRPIIIMTTGRHAENIYDLSQEELSDLFRSLKEFTAFWNIDDYQLSFNMGNWQNHEHFHCKIRLSEKIITRMRRDHFAKIKMDSRYN